MPKRRRLAQDDPTATVTVIVATATCLSRTRFGGTVIDDARRTWNSNNDQGGPLQPPGLLMAAALNEVSESIQRNLDAKKGG